MEAQPEAEATICVPTYVLDSEDSEEESNQEEFPVTSWSELSIIERVGLNSAEMSEGDLETAFSQITLAFRCDQYTLKQRLQAEEHARNLAEENIHLELSRGREILETLKALCLDSKRSNILQKLELSLDIVAGTVERISNTAEVLGAVHQEARVSRAVELMVAHVENLRRRHERTTAELEDAKTLIDPRGSPDLEDGDNRRRSYLKRRVSVSMIPARTQKKLKQHLRKRAAQRESSPCPSPPPSSESSTCATTKEDSSPVDNRPLDPDETPAEDSAAQAPPQPSPDSKQECLPARPLATRKIQTKPHPLDTLRQRHKGKAALSKKKSEKDKKSLNYYRQLSASRSGSLWMCPSAQWLNHRRWSLLCTYLFVLCCVILLTYLLFELL